MESTEEMFILSKYKNIRYLAKLATDTVKNQTVNSLNVNNIINLTSSETLNRTVSKSITSNQSIIDPKQAEKELKEKLKADKQAKKDKMKEMCKPSEKKEKKVKYVDKEKYVNDTPHGEKKDMSKPMLDSYDPTYVESAWDAWWTAKKFFEVDVEKAKTVQKQKRFIMLIPPPNVTGSLHVGHTLMGAIEDSITRWKRMKGYVALWVPGTDHAGIATQSVVEKKLLKEQGKYRSDFTREEFLEKVWQWKNEYGNRIFEQFRRIGVGFDMSRNFFTMDDARSESVREAFVQLHDRGILYRAERIVHWCCALKTAISDVEIEELELDGPTMLSVPMHKGKYEFGVLIDFAYKLKEDTSKEIIVSTTRIETMLGDVAVAVHPDDTDINILLEKNLYIHSSPIDI
jgi:valyl-tRNA synthetase